MILKALYDLAQSEKLLEDPDYVWAKAGYYLSIDAGGRNARLVSVLTERQLGRKTVVDPTPILIPREPSRSGTRAPALFLVDNSKYLFGLGPAKGNREELASYPLEFERFRDRVRSVSGCIAGPTLEAEALGSLLRFLDGPENARLETFREAWEAAGAKDRQHLSGWIYIIFAPEGVTPLHRLPEIQRHWRAERERENAAATVGRCLVTGETLPRADRHTYLKGIPGAATSGVPLVSFNKPAFESYGLDGNRNAPVSRRVAEAYAAGLNRLVANEPRGADGTPLARQNVVLSADSIAVFWSTSRTDLSWFSLFGDNPDSVKEMIRAPKSGRRAPLDDPASFFTLVLSGSQGRAVIRSFLTTTTAEVASSISRYLDDSQIDRPAQAPGNYPLHDLLCSLAPLCDDKRLPPTLAVEVYLAAVSGRPLPRMVLDAAVRRNRLEAMGGSVAAADMFARRCSLIRASLVRRRFCKEEPNVSLDPANRSAGYLLGRLLATIDHIQQNALGSVNASLVDRYYGSASSTPAAVFPALLRRTQHHLGKLRREKPGLAVVRERILQEVTSGLVSFPRTLGLEAQGLFALGFHHQRHAFFSKSKVQETLS